MTPSRQPIWRHTIAFVAAYLLVLQAALAGGAMQRMHAADGFATQVICLNGGLQAPEPDKPSHARFDCCGVGCLMGVHALAAPAGGQQTLPAPQARATAPNRIERGAPVGVTAPPDSRPRAPPAIG